MNAAAEAVTGGGATATLLKSKIKTKAKAKQAPTVNENDWLLKTANEIENLSQEAAFSMLDGLLSEGGFTDFRLGGVLSKIQEQQWLDGHETFRTLVESQFGIQYRKAMYLIQIYRDLVDNQIPWEKVKDLGWTKLVHLSPILKADNLDHWIEIAKTMTVLQLQEAVAAAKKTSGAVDKTAPTSTVVTMTFKLHDDQKATVRQALDKAKAESNTEFDTVALEAICMGYLGGSVQAAAAAQVSLVDVMKTHTPDEVLEAFEQLFPDVNLSIEVEEGI